MISFTNITESIYHIRGTSKQKATTKQILNFLRKKDKYRDLSPADLEEEINTLFTTGLLFKMIKIHFSSEIRQMHQQRIKKINLIVLTTIEMMKQVKMYIVLHRPKRI